MLYMFHTVTLFKGHVLANKLTSTRKGEIIVDNQVWFVHAAFKLHSLCYFITVWFFWLYSELHHNKGKQNFTSHTQNVVNKEHFYFILHTTIITPTFMFSKYTILVVLYIQQAHSLHYDMLKTMKTPDSKDMKEIPVKPLNKRGYG